MKIPFLLLLSGLPSGFFYIIWITQNVKKNLDNNNKIEGKRKSHKSSFDVRW